jgi:predicted PhzF superfamily epimerase YddE/YHI9
MNFPIDVIHKAELTEDLQAGFSLRPLEVYRGKSDYLFIYESEDDIRSVGLDFEKIGRIDARGVIISAPGKETDFVSRFFAPRYGINEDPVTGSAHTTLTRYWSEALNKNELTAIQLSKRKGFLRCARAGDRVEISGRARLYMRGEIYV